MNAADERARLVRERAKEWKLDRRVVEDAFPLPWKSNGVAAQVVFFILTAIGIGALWGFAELIDLDGGAIVFVATIALAEYLIRVRRWFFTGVEAALWLGGVGGAISLLPSKNQPEALLVLALGAAIAGVRVSNPLFGALGAVLVAAYAEDRFDLGVLVALVIASFAVVALLKTWQRPSTEWLFIALALVLPLAGWPMADAKWRAMTIALYALFGVATLVLAIAKRHHALFLGGAIGIAVAATELGRMIAAPLEAKLAGAGAFLLAASWIVARALRDRTRGLVVTPSQLTGADEMLQIAATIALAPEEPEGAPERGGHFGGAGATGDY